AAFAPRGSTARTAHAASNGADRHFFFAFVGELVGGRGWSVGGARLSTGAEPLRGSTERGAGGGSVRTHAMSPAPVPASSRLARMTSHRLVRPSPGRGLATWWMPSCPHTTGSTNGGSSAGSDGSIEGSTGCVAARQSTPSSPVTTFFCTED